MKLTTGYKKPPTDVSTANADSNLLLSNGGDIALSTLYKRGYGLYRGDISGKLYFRVATLTSTNLSDTTTFDNTIDFFVTCHYTKRSGLLQIRLRKNASDYNNWECSAEFHLIVGINPANVILTRSCTAGSEGRHNNTFNIYVKTTAWDPYVFRKLEEAEWGTIKNEWVLLNSVDADGFESIPEELQYVSTIRSIDNTVSGNSASASTLSVVKSTAAAAHYLTFVNSNNDSATNENFYTTANISIVPSTGKITMDGMNNGLVWKVNYLNSWAREFIAFSQHTDNDSNAALSTVFKIGAYGENNGYVYTYIGCGANYNSGTNLRFNKDGSITIGTNKVWHAGNDGTGSGLDADLLDGQHLADLDTRYINTSGDTMTGALTVPSLSVTGAATFSLAINGSILGNATTASRLLNARTISLTGSITGSGSFDGSGNLSISTTTNHNHDDRYLKLSGGTITNTSSVAPLTIKGLGNYASIKLIGDNGHWRTFGVKGTSADLFVTNADGWNSEYLIYHQGNLSPLTTTNYGSYAVSLTTAQIISGNKTFSGSTSIDDLTCGNLLVSGGVSFALFPLSIETYSGSTSDINLAAGTRYKLTVNDKTFVFRTTVESNRPVYVGGLLKVGANVRTPMNFTGDNGIIISYEEAGTGTGLSGATDYFNIKASLGQLLLPSNKNDDSTSSNNRAALFMNNSNIWGVNSIYMSSLSENASEGIHFYRDASHVDSIYAKNGILYFTPNRGYGLAGTDNVIAMHNFKFNGQVYYDVVNDKIRCYTSDGGYAYSKTTAQNVKISFKFLGNFTDTSGRCRVGFVDNLTTQQGGIAFVFAKLNDSNKFFCGRCDTGTLWDIVPDTGWRDFSSTDEFSLEILKGTAYFYKNGLLIITYYFGLVDKYAYLYIDDPNIQLSNVNFELLLFTNGSLGNVLISTPASGQILTYDGTTWINDYDYHLFRIYKNSSSTGTIVSSSGSYYLTFSGMSPSCPHYCYRALPGNKFICFTIEQNNNDSNGILIGFTSTPINDYYSHCVMFDFHNSKVYKKIDTALTEIRDTFRQGMFTLKIYGNKAYFYLNETLLSTSELSNPNLYGHIVLHSNVSLSVSIYIEDYGIIPPISLEELSNTIISNPSNGQVLKYSSLSGVWYNAAV